MTRAKNQQTGVDSKDFAKVVEANTQAIDDEQQVLAWIEFWRSVHSKPHELLYQLVNILQGETVGSAKVLAFCDAVDYFFAKEMYDDMAGRFNQIKTEFRPLNLLQAFLPILSPLQEFLSIKRDIERNKALVLGYDQAFELLEVVPGCLQESFRNAYYCEKRKHPKYRYLVLNWGTPDNPNSENIDSFRWISADVNAELKRTTKDVLGKIRKALLRGLPLSVESLLTEIDIPDAVDKIFNQAV